MLQYNDAHSKVLVFVVTGFEVVVESAVTDANTR